MNLYEHESKKIMRELGITTPTEIALGVPAEITEISYESFPLVAKTQLFEGKRGKSGAVKIINDRKELMEFCTFVDQNWPEAQILIEEKLKIARELYISIIVEAGRGFTMMISPAGGVEIEVMVREQPELMKMIRLDSKLPLLSYQVFKIAKEINLDIAAVPGLTRFCKQLLNIFKQLDATMLEVNPVAVTEDGRIVAADLKLTVDNNALYRQPALKQIHETRLLQDSVEKKMAEHGVQFIPLEGEIGVISCGAGLTMAIIDWLDNYGCRAHSFMDNTPALVKDHKVLFKGLHPDFFAESMSYCLKYFKEQGVKGVLVNITSGGTPVDGLVKGLITAVNELQIDNLPPLIVHAGGNGQEKAREYLNESNIPQSYSLGETVKNICEAV